MSKVTNAMKAEYNKSLYNSANCYQRQSWRKKQQRGFDFYCNDQLSEEEINELESAGMPTFIINRILPIIEIMKFFATANQPRWVGVGVEESDTDVADIHSSIAEYIWRLSKGNTLYPQVILDALTKSLGYFHVRTDTNLDRGMGEVVIDNLSPWDVYVDKASRDFLFRDACFIMIKKSLPRSRLASLLPDYKKKIMIASTPSGFGDETYSERDTEVSSSTQPEDITEAFTITGEPDDILDYYFTYYKTYEAYWNLFVKVQLTEEELRQIRNSVEKQTQQVTTELSVEFEEKRRKIEKLRAEGQIIDERADLEIKRLKEQTLQAIEFKTSDIMKRAIDAQTRMEHKIVTDAQWKEMQKNPDIIETVVNSVKFYEPRINIRCSVSDQFLYERKLDPKIKEYPIIPIPYIHTGTPFPMSACTPLVGKQEEINKAHQITIHNANLSGSLRWLMQEGAVDETQWEKYSSSPGARLIYRQGYDKPEPVHPSPLNNAFFSLVQEGKNDLEYISGIYSSAQGDVRAQHETVKGLLQQDEYSTRRIKAWMLHTVEPALEHLGIVVKQFAQSTYTANKIFRLVNPNNVEKSESVEINMLYPDKTGAIKKFMDYNSANFDVFYVAGSSMPVNRWALLGAYERWLELGAIDDIAFLAETEVKNKEQIMRRKSLYARQADMIKKLEEELKNKEGTIETLERQIVQARIKGVAGESELEIKSKKLDVEAQLKFLRESIRRLEKEITVEAKKTIENPKNNG